MYYHKLALCYELLDRKDKAREALNRALEAPFGTTHLDARSYDADAIRTTFEQMCELVRMRLDNPHYLKNPAYGEALRTCVHNQKKVSVHGLCMRPDPVASGVVYCQPPVSKGLRRPAVHLSERLTVPPLWDLGFACSIKGGPPPVSGGGLQNLSRKCLL